MLSRINPYKTFYLSFASVWLAGVLLNMTFGLFQRPLLVLDSVGVVLLVHDTHPEITKAIDPNDDDDNFFKNDLGIKLLILLGVAVYSVLMILLVYGDEVQELGGVGSRSTAITTVVDIFGFLPRGLFSLLVFFWVYSWVVGLYMYLREPEVGGALHRSFARIQELFEGDYEVRRLRKSLSGEEKRVHVRAGQILLSQLGVGTITSVVFFSISILVLIVLSTPVVTVAAILLWVGYEAIGAQRKTEFLRSLDEATEGPQRLLFDFEVMEAGLEGVTVVFFIVLTFFTPILMLSVFVGLLIEMVATAPEWAFSGALFTPAGGLAFFSYISFLVMGILLTVYSFVVSYSFLNRLSVWLGSTEIVPTQTQDVPDLPKAVSLVYPVSFLIYFGVLFRMAPFASRSLEEPDTVAYVVGSVIVAASPFYVFLVYDAYKQTRTRSVENLVSTPEYDYYRVPLVLSTQFFGIWYLFGDSGLGFVLYVIFTANLIYLIPQVQRFCGSMSSEPLGSILSDTYITILAVLAVFIFLSADATEILSVPEAAVICGVIGGVLYSSTLIEHAFFKD